MRPDIKQIRTLKMLVSLGIFAFLVGSTLDLVEQTNMGFSMGILGIGIGLVIHKLISLKKEAEPFNAKFDKIPKFVEKLTKQEVYWQGYNAGTWRRQYEFDQAEEAKKKKVPGLKFLED
jgi:hypothetical protein